MKRVVVILLSMVMLISLLSACKSGTNIQWGDFELGDKLPALEDVRGEVTSNSKSVLSVKISKSSKEQFRSYRDACIEKGYTIDSEDAEDVYAAFNSEGYQLRLIYSDYDGEELTISLTAPEEMKEFAWPMSGPGALLPATKSNIGRVSWDNSDTFIVHVGNMTIDDYNEYVKACEDKEFTVDYGKDDDYYSAKNPDGYALTLRYLGFNKIEVSIKAPEGSSTSTDNSAEQGNNTSDSNTGIGTEFKAAMDSYENFMNEYVEFMKKYKANPTDMSLLSAYTDYMSRYTTFVNDFAKWEGQTMNAAETVYYLEVQNRVAQKLLEVA